MDRWLLAASTVLAFIGGIGGVVAIWHGHRSKLTVWWMCGCLLLQFGFLYLRGEARGACPLGELGEILAFLGWSLTLFYLLVGPAYRLSLLGVFTAPLVGIIQSVALLPGLLTDHPPHSAAVDGWKETHSAMSVLAYGALALAAVSGVMFLTLDHRLKAHQLKGNLYHNLPDASALRISQVRLLWLGSVLLSLGILAGLFTPFQAGYLAHLIAAAVVWAGYVALLAVHSIRGLTGRGLSWGAVGLFVASLVVFTLI